MNKHEAEASNNNYIVDSKGLFSGRLERKIIEKFGSVGVPDYDGKYRKNIRDRQPNNSYSKSQENLE